MTMTFSNQSHGEVYFIGARRIDAPVKIGFTTGRIEWRLKSIQREHDEPIEVLASFDGTVVDEGRLHMRFAKARLRGEWFTKTPELQKIIAENTL